MRQLHDINPGDVMRNANCKDTRFRTLLLFVVGILSFSFVLAVPALAANSTNFDVNLTSGGAGTCAGSANSTNYNITAGCGEPVGFTNSTSFYVNLSSFIADTTNPAVVYFTLTATSISMGGTTTLGWSTTDNDRVNRVRFRLIRQDGTSEVIGDNKSASGSMVYSPPVIGEHTIELLVFDYAGNSASSSMVISVSEQSSPPTSPGGVVQQTTIKEEIKAGTQKEIAVTAPEQVLTMIDIKVSKDVPAGSKVELTKPVEARPAAAPVDAPGTTFKYFTVRTNPELESAATDVKLNFKVEKSWLASKSVNEGQVRLSRLSGDTWTVLPTQKVRGDDTYIYFKAASPGLSVYAITAIEGAVALPPGEELVVKECDASAKPGEDWGACTDNKQSRTLSDCDATTGQWIARTETRDCAPAEGEKPTAVPSTGIIIAIVVLLILGGLWYMKTKGAKGYKFKGK